MGSSNGILILNELYDCTKFHQNRLSESTFRKINPSLLFLPLCLVDQFHDLISLISLFSQLLYKIASITNRNSVLSEAQKNLTRAYLFVTSYNNQVVEAMECEENLSAPDLEQFFTKSQGI